jgi:hypothetical protein
MGHLDGDNLLGFLEILKDYLVWLRLSGENPYNQGNVGYLLTPFGRVCGFPSIEVVIHIPLAHISYVSIRQEWPYPICFY